MGLQDKKPLDNKTCHCCTVNKCTRPDTEPHFVQLQMCYISEISTTVIMLYQIMMKPAAVYGTSRCKN